MSIVCKFRVVQNEKAHFPGMQITLHASPAYILMNKVPTAYFSSLFCFYFYKENLLFLCTNKKIYFILFYW